MIRLLTLTTSGSLKTLKTFRNLFPSRFAVLTGGEPSIHRHTPLVMESLLKLGFKDFAMESNGCHPIPEGVNFLTVSPKKRQPKAFRKRGLLHSP